MEDLIRGVGFDVINHHAAQIDVRVSVADPALDARVNVAGLLNILEAARASGTGRILFVSSGGVVYGEPHEIPTPERAPKEPLSPYGVTKLAGEHYLNYYREVHGMDYVALRYSNVYGPRQDPHGEAGVVAIFSQRLLRGEPLVIYGDGEQTRDYIHVGDVVRANLMAARMDLSPAPGLDSRAYNVGDGDRDIRERAGRHPGRSGRYPHRPRLPGCPFRRTSPQRPRNRQNPRTGLGPCAEPPSGAGRNLRTYRVPRGGDYGRMNELLPQAQPLRTPLDMIVGASIPTQIVLVVLGLFSVLSLWVIISKVRHFRTVRREGDRFLGRMEEAGNLTEASEALIGLPESPYTRLFRSGLSFFAELSPGALFGSSQASGLSLTQLEALRLVMDKVEAEEIDELAHGLNWLAIIGSVSPLLGLMGTVIGIMNTFLGITASRSTNISAVGSRGRGGAHHHGPGAGGRHPVRDRVQPLRLPSESGTGRVRGLCERVHRHAGQGGARVRMLRAKRHGPAEGGRA